MRIADSYNDRSVLFRVLRNLGWGDLVNVGHLTWPTLPLVVTELAWFQRRLARRSLALLDARPGETVLDACCGRGLTTAMLGRRGVKALGVDLQPEQIAIARDRFGTEPNVRFAVADVTALGLADGGVDRIHCLEAAFHFGPDGRAAFLREAFRVLRPGGRLVLVDFTWPDDDPGRIAACDPRRLVRDTWHFDEFEPLDRYQRVAADAGFTITAVHDWTDTTLAHYRRASPLAQGLLSSGIGRRLVGLRWPGLRELTDEQWRHVVATLQAHDTALVGPCRYTAFVLSRETATLGRR